MRKSRYDGAEKRARVWINAGHPDQFGPRPDARQVPTLRDWFWPGTDRLTPLNIIQSQMLIVHRPAGIWHTRET